MIQARNAVERSSLVECTGGKWLNGVSTEYLGCVSGLCEHGGPGLCEHGVPGWCENGVPGMGENGVPGCSEHEPGWCEHRVPRQTV